MKYLIIGSGGREHTLYWRLMNDGSADEVYVAPGNGGISEKYCVNISVSDFEAISGFCTSEKIDAVVVGPEVPLVGGLVDYLEERKIPAFGPRQKAAMLEGSKLFAKSIMEKYGVPTAGYKNLKSKEDILNYIETVENYPIVIKLDGLAAGKGVGIPENRDEAIEFVNQNVEENTEAFIEDYIDGEEASVLGISDGDTIIPLVAAQDHKRIFDGDKGPNTGGMGAYAPAPIMDDSRLKRVYSEVLKPTIDGMKSEGILFKGILYAGLIINGDDMKVLEFNTRFGDPEAQVILPLLNEKFGDIMDKVISGSLKDIDITFKNKSAITVVISSGGYPGSYEKGKEIKGLNEVSDKIITFHAGTKSEAGEIYTNGGRVLNVTAMGDTLIEARDLVYNEIDKISFEGSFYRKDIAHRAL